MKNWFESKTIIFNLFCCLLATLEASLSLFQEHLPFNFYAILVVGMPVVNMYLRMITDKGIK
jgi:hypothetical protein